MAFETYNLMGLYLRGFYGRLFFIFVGKIRQAYFSNLLLYIVLHFRKRNKSKEQVRYFISFYLPI